MLIRHKLNYYQWVSAGAMIMVCLAAMGVGYVHHAAFGKLDHLARAGIAFSEVNAQSLKLRDHAIDMIAAVGTPDMADDDLIRQTADRDTQSLLASLALCKQALETEPALNSSLEKLAPEFNRHVDKLNLVLNQIKVDPAGAEMYTDDYQASFRKLSEEAEAFHATLRTDILSAKAQADRALLWGGGLLIAMVVIAGIGLLITGRWLSSSIIQPLHGVSSIARDMANGKISEVDASQRSNDELGDLLKLMQQGQNRIRNLLSQATQDVNVVAVDLSSVTTDFVNSAQIQSEHVAAMHMALQGLSEAIAQISSSAEQANQLTKKAGASTEQSCETIMLVNEKISSLSTGMELASDNVRMLASRTEHIAAIAESIQSVAGQTNLLSLNAAIEAARAGDAGRGFAVVADKVRDLSHQTAELAQDITQLVGEIRSEASGATGAMARMSSEVAETSVATDQARAGVEEIAHKIASVKFMMQATASSLVVQAASTRDMTGRLAHVENAAGNNLQTAQGLRNQIDQLVNAAGSLEYAVSAA